MTTLATLPQGYDDAGNLTLAYSADRGTSYVYRYDHHNRLTGVYDDTNTTRKAAFAWDALGRRVEFADDVVGVTNRFYFDGVNELVEDNPGGTRQRYYVHGVSYVDERLMMFNDDHQRPYYYTIDRMYNVRAIVDRAGAVVERYAYDGYGRPYIRESAGRGDMNDDTMIDGDIDNGRFRDAKNDTIWDPRADLDDDGDVDDDDGDLFDLKKPSWDPSAWPGFGTAAQISQAFSDVDNRYMFQGVPNFVMDTAANAITGKLLFNHHRARFAHLAIGRWTCTDPLHRNPSALRDAIQLWLTHMRALPFDPGLLTPNGNSANHFLFLLANPFSSYSDPSGLGQCLTGGVPNYDWCTQQAAPTAGSGVYGKVLCCCCKKITAVYVWNIPGLTDPGAIGAVTVCATVHETTHLDDINCGSGSPLQPPWANPNPLNTNYQEFVAYCAERACLQAQLAHCQTIACTNQVNAHIASVNSQIATFGGGSSCP